MKRYKEIRREYGNTLVLLRLEPGPEGEWVKYEDHVKEYNNIVLKKTDEIIEKQKIIDKMRKEILDKQNELRILLTKKMGK
ncbi:hypothetical protein LCGC14_2196170 [marine sediment metagenome]|uniref:Uncharacterized protein n=1 Tax=marine sediment metagenome TaxID=412755 RepID=A0A0F9DI93_9ZZZZ